LAFASRTSKRSPDCKNGYSGKLEKGIRHLGALSLPMLLAALDADLYLAPRSDIAPVEESIGSAAGSGYSATSRAQQIPQE
jgi:hypothetical protein